jgi:hypothetical protein
MSRDTTTPLPSVANVAFEQLLRDVRFPLDSIDTVRCGIGFEHGLEMLSASSDMSRIPQVSATPQHSGRNKHHKRAAYQTSHGRK